ncbi:MAG: hypothetical protein NTW87_36715 [Planctomycetota bacterium]|nr:hypothetical protein [Planctomycetota bacterium]
MSREIASVYLDSNILSTLHYRGRDAAVLRQHAATQLWWDTERRWFRLLASRFTEEELAAGNYPGQKHALAEVRRLPYLPFSAAVKTCARTYLDEGLVPASKPGDAFQLAFATVYVVDYLLTWNQTHLANGETQEKLKRINAEHGWRTPLLMSPVTISKVALGQSVRRRHED